MEKCPCCSSKIILEGSNRNLWMPTLYTEFINKYHKDKFEKHCQNCGKRLYSHYKNEVAKEIEKLIDKQAGISKEMPVVTIHNPVNWNYDSIGLVSGHSVIGTGFFSELSGSIADLTGGKAFKHLEKLKNAENQSLDEIRINAIRLGANAVISASLSYNEIGGQKGMIMVCVTGTAVFIKNPNDVLNEKQIKAVEAIEIVKEEIKDLEN